MLYCSHMPSDAEITFADHAGRLYARRYGMAPMVGRLLGYLMVCWPREQSIGELAEALLASRSAIAVQSAHWRPWVWSSGRVPPGSGWTG